MTDANPAASNPAQACTKRVALAKKLEEAAESVLSAKREYDDLRKSRFAPQEELFRLVDAWTNARKKAREAQRAFDAHVAVHHCAA